MKPPRPAEFVGREAQLAILRDELAQVRASGEGRFVSIRGRRRVGKSTLVERFLQLEKPPHVFFTASRQSPPRELDLFAEELAVSDLPAAEVVRGGLSMDSWETALSLIASTAADRPAVVVIDEFPYLTEADRSVEGTLQKIWDRRLRRAPVLLVLIGSDISMMEALTEYGRPLYGRPTREMVVRPLTPAETGEMLGLAAEDALDAYLIVGGFPQVARSWHGGTTPRRFLAKALLDPTSPLIVGGERALYAEFPPHTYARAVLAAIGSGERTFKGIGTSAGKSATPLRRALALLGEKGVILKSIPFAAKDTTRATRYTVADPYLRFWLRFVEPNLDLIERGRGHLAYERVIAGWSEYRGKAIEPIVRESVERLLPDPRFGEARFVNGFWTRDNLIEIDLVGADKRRHPSRAVLAGSIKWRDKSPFDRRDLRALNERVSSLPRADENTLLVGVSRAGFDVQGLDIALGPDDLLAAWRRSRPAELGE